MAARLFLVSLFSQVKVRLFVSPIPWITEKGKQKMSKTKIVIALALVAVATVCAVSLKRAANLHAYAESNNCEWSATGTAYGDDRDWICK